MTLLLASLAVVLLVIAAAGAAALHSLARGHPGLAAALYGRRTEIAVAGVSLLAGVTILAALSRWVI